MLRTPGARCLPRLSDVRRLGPHPRGRFEWGPQTPPPPSVLEPANPRTDSEGASGCTWSTARATAPSPGRPTPGVVKQDQSSVDTTKTRSGPRRVRMSSGERPIGATKGTPSDTEALCQPPPPPPAHQTYAQWGGGSNSKKNSPRMPLCLRTRRAARMTAASTACCEAPNRHHRRHGPRTPHRGGGGVVSARVTICLVHPSWRVC